MLSYSGAKLCAFTDTAMALGLHRINTRLSAAYVSLGLAAIVAGCATPAPRDTTADWSPNRIYQEAKDEQSAGNFEKASALFDKLEGRAAGTPLAQQAQLDKAFAQYKASEPAQATATLTRFLRLHPASTATDYALYLMGLVSFNDDLGLFGSLGAQDLSERDQKAAKDSFESFRELTTRFPDSRYSKDAALRMTYIVNSLAQSEVHVARHYFTRGVYVAAINRAQKAISQFKDAPALEEALYILMRSYDALGMVELRNDTQRVMDTNYPNSQFANDSLNTTKSWWTLW
jgi:outer membrane protein assembly factor BamD